MTQNHIYQKYGGKIRVRVCGLCLSENKLLMVGHTGLGPTGTLWLPPGGGCEFQHSLEDNLIREIEEETGLIVSVEQFLFIYELIEPPLHAIELFFRVIKTGGSLKTGKDPEMGDHQIISGTAWMEFEEILSLGFKKIHHIFQYASKLDDLLAMRGCFSKQGKK